MFSEVTNSLHSSRLSFNQWLSELRKACQYHRIMVSAHFIMSSDCETGTKPKQSQRQHVCHSTHKKMLITVNWKGSRERNKNSFPKILQTFHTQIMEPSVVSHVAKQWSRKLQRENESHYFPLKVSSLLFPLAQGAKCIYSPTGTAIKPQPQTAQIFGDQSVA